ncbi:aminomethyltransferase family protein [Erwinia endophytica]|uniref:aminomethyltransferase family protein n=1 Tax=Erwinia endophytica TaxID=1563158 RepID=UPI00186B8F4E|nr:aminomethyltransferase family protein [Erwinia endophytica]
MNHLTELHHQNGVRMTERNGKTVPARYNSPEQEHLAVRRHILLSDYSHFGQAKISGESAWELLNVLVSGDVSSIRDEQAMYTLMLDDDGKIITDLYILCDEEHYLLISEWLSGDELCEKMQAVLISRGDEFDEIDEIVALDDHGILHIEGPYSWELLVERYGIDVAGLPFQEHMHVADELTLLRSGKHGEYSYKLMGEYAELAEAWPQLVEAGEKFDMRCGGLDYQQQVRLENPCWQPETLSHLSRCPIELQLQWMVRYDKDDFIGLSALKARLEAGPDNRVIGMSIEGQPEWFPQRGEQVWLDGEVVGQVIECGYSADLDKTIGRLFLDTRFAWADLPGFSVRSSGGQEIMLKTAAVPFARNYSFLVNPTEHSYIDTSRPRDLLQQLEWQKAREEEERAAAAATSNE